MEIIMRNTILLIGWPILIAGSVFILVMGQRTYQHVKGSMVGKITSTLVISMLAGMYSLGIVSTVLMFVDSQYIWAVLGIFIVWFITFVLVLKTLHEADKETRKIIG